MGTKSNKIEITQDDPRHVVLRVGMNEYHLSVINEGKNGSLRVTTHPGIISIEPRAANTIWLSHK